MTHAEKGLSLSGAEGRNLDGSLRYPSRFVLDIDSGLLEYTEKPNVRLIADAREYAARTEQYLPEDWDAGKSVYLVQFDKTEFPRKISIRAKLSQL